MNPSTIPKKKASAQRTDAFFKSFKKPTINLRIDM